MTHNRRLHPVTAVPASAPASSAQTLPKPQVLFLPQVPLLSLLFLSSIRSCIQLCICDDRLIGKSRGLLKSPGAPAKKKTTFVVCSVLASHMVEIVALKRPHAACVQTHHHLHFTKENPLETNEIGCTCCYCSLTCASFLSSF